MKTGGPINVVYLGARRLPVLTICVSMAMAAICLNAGLRPDFMLCGGVCVSVLMAYMLCRFFKRLPRLTLSDQGVVLEQVFSTRRIHWVSLGAFSDVPVSWRGGGVITAVVTGRSADPKSLQRGNIMLAAGSFAGRHNDFVAELNAWRAQALGDLGITATASVSPLIPQQTRPVIAGRSLLHVGKVFALLWLAMLAGIMVPLLADELVLLATGAHVPAGMLGGFMVIGLVAAALAAGYAAARSVSFRLSDLARGALLYLLSIAAVLALPGMTPHSRIGLIIVAVLPPPCMSFACWTTRRQHLNQTSGI